MRAGLNRLALCAMLCSAIAMSQALGQTTAAQPLVARAQRQVIDYLAQLANIHCTESVLQQKLAPNGHVQSSRRRSYDYLVMIQGDRDDFQLNESRIPQNNAPQDKLPMLVTDGFSTLMLVFHPYYSGSFEFQRGADEMLNGRPVATVRFVHIHGMRTLAALALRGREYPLELQGTAWLDKASGQVLKIDAELLGNMSDIGLRSLKIHAEYQAIHLGSSVVTLPVVAVVDVTTPRQHWRNTHTFGEYKLFGTVAEQNADVKLKVDAPANITTEKP